MRVLFAGHTGLGKDIIVHNFAKMVLRSEGLPEDFDHSKSRHFLRLYDVERLVEEQINASHVSLLETANPLYAEEQWSMAFEQICGELDKSEHAFINMHLTFDVPGRSPKPYRLDQLKRLQLTDIITLIDDLYEVHARIELINEERHTDYHFRLRDLAKWRAREIGEAHWLARNLPPQQLQAQDKPQEVRHFVVAAKHPRSMLHKLLFKRGVAKVYASVPITATRDDPIARAEIDGIREKLYSLHTVFDPLTIDELVPWVIDESKRVKIVKLEKGDFRCRWPINEAETLGGGRKEVYPITLDAHQVKDVASQIEHSIRLRDFGLVDVCDFIVGYRPRYEGSYSRGMFAEFDHAQNVCRPPIQIHYYSPPEDSTGIGPFDQFRIRYQIKEKWWRTVEKLKPFGVER